MCFIDVIVIYRGACFFVMLRSVGTVVIEGLKRATRSGDVNNHIADHHLQRKHQIDWNSATCISILQITINDLLYTAGLLRETPFHRIQQLPAPYK